MTLKNVTIVGLLAVLFAFSANAQTVTLTETTLSSALAATDRTVCVASATGISVPAVGVQGTTLFVDQEQLRVNAQSPASATCFLVTRGGRPVGHASGEKVYVLPAQYAYQYDPSGTCVLASMRVRPWINVATGVVSDCVSSKWTAINGPATRGTGLTSLGPATAGNITIGSAALPFQKIYLGTAATNNLVITPSATAAARTVTMPDPGGNDSLAYIAAAQTLTNKTITGAIVTDTARATAEFVAVTGTTGTTLTNVTGMSVTVVPGTYRFYVNLPGVATANSGIKAGFKYTTTVVGAMESIARIFTASAVAVQHSTTATDQATLAGSTSAAISTVIEGTMVVTTGGTIQLQAAQNAAHADETKVYVGASMTFTRIS